MKLRDSILLILGSILVVNLDWNFGLSPKLKAGFAFDRTIIALIYDFEGEIYLVNLNDPERPLPDPNFPDPIKRGDAIYEGYALGSLQDGSSVRIKCSQSTDISDPQELQRNIPLRVDYCIKQFPSEISFSPPITQTSSTSYNYNNVNLYNQPPYLFIFVDQREITQRIQQISARMPNPEIKIFRLENESIFLIRIGSLSSQEEAERYKILLENSLGIYVATEF